MKRVSALLLTCTLGLSALSAAPPLPPRQPPLCPAGDDLRRGGDAL